jgi:hypothetical protein
MKRIANIIVLVIALAACIVSFIFAGSFDEKKKDKYYATLQVKECHPEMITDLQKATPEALPQYVDKYQALIDSTETLVNQKDLQRNIFYTFISHLSELQDTTFEAFKNDFPRYSSILFKKADNKDYYVNGFNNVKSFDQLSDYINTLKADYESVKQDYLVSAAELKQMKEVVKWSSDINAAISVEKKQHDLSQLQDEVVGFQKQAKLINITVNLIYVLAFLTIALLLFFAIRGIVSDFKSSMGMLLGVVALIVVFLIGYFVSPDVHGPSAVKENLMPSTIKLVGAGTITTYVVFFGAILSIFATVIINAFKK